MTNNEENKELDIKIDESADNPFKNQDDTNNDKKEETELKSKSEKQEDKKDKKQKDDKNYKEEYEKLNSQYIRLAADFDNFRKRQAQERETLLKYGLEEALKKMILVLDNFDRAKKSLKDCEDYTKYKESIELLNKQVIDELTKLGMEKIEAEGKEFDPNFHEAVMQTPTNDKPEHTIIQELQQGYKFGDKVLRPTMVNVAVSE